MIVRREAVTEADTPYLLMKVDLEKKENFVYLTYVELGSALTSVLAKLSVKDEVKMKFWKDCVAIIVKIIEKLKERCSLKSSIMQNDVCLSPIEMEYQTFFNSVIVSSKEKLFSFDKDVDHLDSFLDSYMKGDANYAKLWNICRIIFVLWHGQADIEKRFNVSNEN